MRSAAKEWLLVTDLDGTLAERDAAATGAARDALAWLQERGVHLCLASGKPCAYLSGVARMLGIGQAALIGENGCVLWQTSQMPTRAWRAPIAPTAAEALGWVRRSLPREFRQRIFMQPNEVVVTAFPVDADPSLPGELEAFLHHHRVDQELEIYRHADSVECVPRGVDKALALDRLLRRRPAARGRVIAVGDGANDVALLRVADIALRVGDHPALAGEDAREVSCFADLPRVLEPILTGQAEACAA